MAEPASTDTGATTAAAALGFGHIRDQQSACDESAESHQKLVHPHPPSHCPAHNTA
jgi:hypothetical protein